MDAAPTQRVPHNRAEEPQAYGIRATEFQRLMAERTAQQDAAFVLPLLQAGISLLDCGCGPGSITIGLAKVVAPGEVVGTDISKSALESAQKLATEQGVNNVRFESANVYKLPFPDDSFDVVFSNALFEHLADPPAALQEMKRVLKSGGVAAIHAADRDGYISVPENPLAAKYAESADRLRAEGATAHIGKHLRRLLREAGFTGIVASASYDSYGTPERVRKLCETVAANALQPGRAKELIQRGYMTQAELEEIAAACRRLANDPDAFFAQARCEAIGWKE